jgi:hypothetical protein
VIVIVRILVPPKGTEFGANALAMESPVTPRVDDAGWSFVAPSAVVIRPAGMVFVYDPAGVRWNALTLIWMEQVAPDAIDPPVKSARLLTVLGKPVFDTKAAIPPQFVKLAEPGMNSRLLPDKG